MADIEELVGYNDVKTSLATYFYVQRKSYYSKTESVIPFDVQLMNVGGAMNLATGIFTAPVAGRYFFTLSGLAQGLETYLHLMLNGGIIGARWRLVLTSINFRFGSKRRSLFVSCKWYCG